MDLTETLKFVDENFAFDPVIEPTLFSDYSVILLDISCVGIMMSFLKN